MTEELVIRFPQSILLNGPQPEDYPFTQHFFRREYLKDKEGFTELFAHIRQEVKAFHAHNSVAGFCYQQPHGYAGDYEMIERLYTRYVSEDSTVARWDRFAQAQPAAKAVRNRKTYFMKLLESRPYTSVLNLASGPCRDLKEYFDQYTDADVQVDCVELDKNAIAYAQNLLGANGRVRFFNQNVLRLQTEARYDLVWSAGLFDYFTDAIFVRVLSRMLKNLNPGGELVIGNFSDTNPNRAFMEVAMNWHLHHRSEKKLTELALAAGATHHHIRVQQEAEGVNLFLHIRDKG